MGRPMRILSRSCHFRPRQIAGIANRVELPQMQDHEITAKVAQLHQSSKVVNLGIGLFADDET